MFTYKPDDSNEIYLTLEDGVLRITDGILSGITWMDGVGT